MSNTQTTSRMDNQQDLLKDPEWWKKYKPGEWEDLEEDLALATLTELAMERMQQNE